MFNTMLSAAQAFADVLFDLLDHHYQFPAVEEEDPRSMEEALGYQASVSAEAPESKPQSSHIYDKARQQYEGGLDAMKVKIGLLESQKLHECWRDLEEVSSCWASAAANLLQSISDERHSLSDHCNGKQVEIEVQHCVVSRGEISHMLHFQTAF
jgi:hypothetical protein